MNDSLHQQDVFASIVLDKNLYDVDEKYTTALEAVLQNMKTLRDDPDKLRFIQDETSFDIAAGFAELKKTSLSIRNNWDPNDDDLESGWEPAQHQRYATLGMSARSLHEYSQKELETLIGHEMGETINNLVKHKTELDKLEETPKTVNSVLNPRQAFKAYDHTSRDLVKANWEKEYRADIFAAALDPDGASIGTVIGYGAINDMFMTGTIGLPVARFLGNMCSIRNNVIMACQSDPVSASKHIGMFEDVFGTNLNEIFGMGVDPEHPPPVARSVADTDLRQKLKSFEQKRR